MEFLGELVEVIEAVLRFRLEEDEAGAAPDCRRRYRRG